MSQSKSQSNRKYVLLAAVIIVILSVILAWFIYNNYVVIPNWRSVLNNIDNSLVSSTTTPPTSSTPNLPSAPIPNATVAWRGQGLPMADLGLIVSYADSSNGQSTKSFTSHYYDMGTDGSNKIIMATSPDIDTGDMGGGLVILFFEQTSNGYKFMQDVSEARVYTFDSNYGYSYGYSFSSLVTSIDTTTIYNDTAGPSRLNYHGVSLYQSYIPIASDLFTNYADEQKNIGITMQKLGTIDSGDMYVQQRTQDKFVIKKYILKLKSGLYALYNLQYPFISDDGIPQITWTGGIQNKDGYRTDANMGGCGTPGAVAVPLQDISTRIQQTGTTSDSQAIYEFKSQDDPIVKYFFDFGGKIYNQTTGQLETVSLKEFWSHHAVILYKNGLGDYAIFTNNIYGGGAECGKPVIYLYPTQTTDIHVKVGADITVSEPTYNKGWNVQAEPDGTLTNVDGKIYDSLFWEGIGHGNYPAITEGTIVSKSKIAETLKSQLAELGLSQKESSDFLEFWLPKMPATPYTRLTWFTTSQLNELAPLAVLPRPDTTIRVFLDFQGLESPIAIPAQHLTTIPRKGFTLIEWGGLLKK